MKVTTDGCLFGAWVAENIRSNNPIAIGSAIRILDIGTGTGLLSLMLAQQSNATIDAVEIDKEAWQQAVENIADSSWADRIHVTLCDAKEFWSSWQYDVIISNPPFYENELKSDSSKKNKAHHDEGLLLDDLLTIIQRNLQPEGEFYLLLPYKRNNEIENLIVQNNLTLSYKMLVKQSTQHGYFRVMLSGKHSGYKNKSSITTEIAICNELKEYTPEFIHLLQHYYLYL